MNLITTTSQNNLPIPLALYIHLPWCVRKCPYCDFNSHALRDELPEEQYIAALIADLDHDLTFAKQRNLHSIFIGGGTPSLFSPAAIETLLTAVHKRFNCAANMEITLEANPGTVDFQRFAGYRAAGVNRLSIGIQSFQADKLKTLGRIHNNDEAVRAAEVARAADFTNFNLDLMHGLPQQTCADAMYDLETALALQPTHLSWYQLTLEPNTLFHKQPPQLPADDLIWDMQDRGRELFAKHNFMQYEISAYSQAGKQCQHNLNYWQFGDYLGIGAGAHGKITDVNTKTTTRYWKRKNPKNYLEALQKTASEENTLMNPFSGEEKIIASQELAFEFMLNALRLHQDIPADLFTARTGLTFDNIAANLQAAQAKELLRWNREVVQPTDLGRRFYNDLVGMFI